MTRAISFRQADLQRILKAASEKNVDPLTGLAPGGKEIWGD